MKRLLKIADLAPVLAEKLERDGISWRDAPYIHEDVRQMIESEQIKNGEGCAANWWLRSATSPFSSLRSTETQNTIAQLQAQITARQKEDMQMRLTAEMVNAAVFTPREAQTIGRWPIVPDEVETVLYADNAPVCREWRIVK